ncbi:MAG: ribokinase [Chloroflexi bacterium]|nr:ribokinase [Chloroflexota bacterium]MDA1228482.1 ribokinase [Chloroflexota bacterium]
MTGSVNAPIVVVLGSINMDLVATMPRMPVSGETIMGDSFHTTPGGKGANQAVAAAKLGANVRMVGRVGNDAFGPTLLDGLRGHGIDVSGVAIDPSNSTGIAMILLESNGQNRIMAVYGANMGCDNAQLEAATRALEGADVLLLQLEVPLEVSLAAAEYARSQGIRVVWDPAPARELPVEAFVAADILTPNQSEAEILTGIRVVDVDSAEAAARAILAKGTSVAIVKLGEEGLVFATKDQVRHLPAFDVNVVDSVAAGDAFGGGLAVGLGEGKALLDAVRLGMASGALAVTMSGAQEAMPTRQEVQALIARSQAN